MGLLNSLQYAFTTSKDGGLVKWAVGEEAEGGAASVRRVGRVCAAGGHGAREEDLKKGKGAKKAKSNKKKTNFGPRINAVAVSSDGKFLVSKAYVMEDGCLSAKIPSRG